MLNYQTIPDSFLFPYVRFFNAIPGKSKYDFYSGNTLIAAGIPFGAFSSYIKLTNGKNVFKITECGKKNNVFSQIIINFNVGEVFTVCAIENHNSISLYGINEPTEKENMQYGHLRICNLASECANVQVYAGNECIACDVHYLDFTKYICIIPGKYDLSVKDEESKAEYVKITEQYINQGKFNSLYITGVNPENNIPYGIFTVDAACYSGFYL